MDYVISILPQMWEGTLETIRLFAITIVLSIPLGVLLALGRVSGFKALRDIIGVYVWLLRGTPLMLQLLFVYYGLPFIPGIGVRLDDFPAAVFAFVLNYAAYFCEIFRAGIQSIDKGQMEAGRSLGMTWYQTMRYVIMPQALKRIIPPLGNEFIAMLKDSSLVSVIGFEELTRRGQLIIARTYASFEIWLAVAVIYLIMTFTVARLVGLMERRFETK